MLRGLGKCTVRRTGDFTEMQEPSTPHNASGLVRQVGRLVGANRVCPRTTLIGAYALLRKVRSQVRMNVRSNSFSTRENHSSTSKAHAVRPDAAVVPAAAVGFSGSPASAPAPSRDGTTPQPDGTTGGS